MAHASDLVPVAEPDIGDRELAYVTDAVRSGWISSAGAYVDRFEAAFAELCGVTHAVAVANGTVALHLALHGAGIGPGDEVIVPSLTFGATAAAVSHAGATPVFVESTERYWCMDPRAVEAAVRPATKAILAVHLYGHPADMEALQEIARARRLLLVEDAAEAHGARCRGRTVGSIGHVGCFSFYGNKILTTGEGGMVTTDDGRLAARLRYLKNHAMEPRRRYWHGEVGFNYRMTNLQAALGCAQVERFDELRQRRAQLLALYRAALADVPGIRLNPRMQWADPAPWLVCAVLEGGQRARDVVTRLLAAEGYDTRPFFGLLHEMPPYRGCRYHPGVAGGDADRALSRGGVSLPSARCVTDDDVVAVARVLLSAMRGASRPEPGLEAPPSGSTLRP